METNESFNIDFNINIELKPIFKTDFLNCQYDEIEINGCYYDTDHSAVCGCDDKDAEFWSVYLHRLEGGVDCIADCKTLEAAQRLEKLLLLTLYTNTQTKKQLRNNLVISAVYEAYGEFLKEDERISKLPETEATGHPFIICTNICKWLKEHHFPGAMIMGYNIEKNPEAYVGQRQGGHDFLFVEERYIIDFWYRHVESGRRPFSEKKAPIMFDTTTSDHLYKLLYGNPSAWEVIAK